MWGYKLWSRVSLLRKLVAYFESIGVTSQEALSRWANKSGFESDFEGKIPGMGYAIYQWLIMRQGIETIKPDVHLRRFVESLIHHDFTDHELIAVLERVAKQLWLKAYELDWRIWEYQRRDRRNEMEERKGVVTFQGNPVTLLGAEIRLGQKAPDFKLLAMDMTQVELSQSRGKVRLLSVVPSLDTPVCDLQTQRFEEEASKFKDVEIYTMSMDLPCAQARYCGAHNISNPQTLSDHREASFGTAYGVLIKELRLLSRAIFIIDRDDTVPYAEYVKEISEHPDYDRAFEALKNVIAGS